MKIWPIIICSVVILALVCSPVFAISKAEAISTYTGHSHGPTIPTQAPIPERPQWQDMSTNEWNISAFMQKTREDYGPCYKSDPTSPFCFPWRFKDTTSKSGSILSIITY
jgi:hypothetical protein